jgi:hydrogenase nickel incorporation protein HypA/HybF
MHEFSIARSLLNQVHAIARRENATHVTSIALSVGEFSGIDADLLRSALEMLGEQGVTGDVELTIRRVPLTARCSACDDDFAVPQFRFACPSCHSTETRIVSGEEITLDSVTLEREREATCGETSDQREAVCDGESR